MESEALANAVANEWLAQKDTIMLSQMHINALCNTCIDNPGRTDKEKLVNSILGFLSTDTILFYSEKPDSLLSLQRQKWSPVIVWFNQRYGVSIEPTLDIVAPPVSERDKKVLEKHLLSYGYNALQGLSFGVDALKSLILSLAVVDRHLTVAEAVAITRLELQFQTAHWGTVEWAHDLELHDTTARLAAANLFIHFSSSVITTKTKNFQH